MAGKRKDGFYWVVAEDVEGTPFAVVAWYCTKKATFQLPQKSGGSAYRPIKQLEWAAPYNRPIRPQDTIPSTILKRYKISCPITTGRV
jgi:hypothetical protein